MWSRDKHTSTYRHIRRFMHINWSNIFLHCCSLPNRGYSNFFRIISGRLDLIRKHLIQYIKITKLCKYCSKTLDPKPKNFKRWIYFMKRCSFKYRKKQASESSGYLRARNTKSYLCQLRKQSVKHSFLCCNLHIAVESLAAGRIKQKPSAHLFYTDTRLQHWSKSYLLNEFDNSV
jgi:hypothetical protein